MEIHLTKVEAYGEPGPNVVWLTSKQEIHDLIDRIHDLCAGKIPEIRFQESGSTKLTGCNSIVLRCNPSTRNLAKLSEHGSVISELPERVWSLLIDLLVPLSQANGFQYLEVDGMPELVEDANWIIESRDEPR